METEILLPDKGSLKYAAKLITDGEVVAVPTETVYGLAANAYNSDACAKIFKAKGRPQDNPLIIHICSIEMLGTAVKEIHPLALKLAERFWPGPLTMIFDKKSIVPDTTSGGLGTVAARMPDNEYTLKLIELCNVPLAAPSANTSGKPSPTDALHVYNDMNGKIPLIIDGGECRTGVESTVICFTDNNSKIKILRPGAITKEMLGEFADTELDKNVFTPPKEDERVISPGVKYKHYSPKAKVTVIDTDDEKKFTGFLNAIDKPECCGIIYGGEKNINIPTIAYGDTADMQAHRLFSVLRELDTLCYKEAYIRRPVKGGVGEAVYNRLLRAAAFRVIKL